MAWLDEHLAGIARGNSSYIVREKLKYERATRAYKTTYERLEPTDLPPEDTIKKVRMHLSGAQEYEGLIESALDHLADALDIRLPDDVRVEHWNIAGARIWVAITRVGATPPHYWRAFEAWLDGSKPGASRVDRGNEAAESGTEETATAGSCAWVPSNPSV